MSIRTSIKTVTFASLTIVAMIFTGCSDDKTTTPTDTTVTPKAGSSYTYTQHYKDSTSTGVTENDSTIVATVLSSGLTFSGKANTITLLDGNGADTLRYVMESNGDVSVYRASFSANVGTTPAVFINPTPWMTLPFGSKKTGVALFTGYDTISVGGLNVPLVIVGTADYISVDTVKDGSGKKIASGNLAKLTITVTGGFPGLTVKATVVQTYAFDPTIGGYFHSINTFDLPPVLFGGTTYIQSDNSIKTKILTSYNLIK